MKAIQLQYNITSLSFQLLLFIILFNKRSISTNQIFFIRTNANLRRAVSVYQNHGDDSPYGPIAAWDTSHITDMSLLFYDYYRRKFKTFNGNISNWNVTNVTTMSRMFSQAHFFNATLRDWDVSCVTDMSNMFQNSQTFQGNIG